MAIFEMFRAFFSSFFADETEANLAALRAAKDAAPVGSVEELKAEIALLKATQAAASAPKVKRYDVKKLAIKRSENGGVNLFLGFRRFPVFVYAAEIEAILYLVESGKLLTFLEENGETLSRAKSDTPTA